MFLKGAYTRTSQTFLGKMLSIPARNFATAELQAFNAANEETLK
jgi:hypothetical protein